MFHSIALLLLQTIHAAECFQKFYNTTLQVFKANMAGTFLVAHFFPRNCVG